MKITPIEIRQHTFEKSLRGYRTDEVDAFLASLSQEWERVTSEQKMLKMQLELAEKELGKLKEIELTLFRTLKTAEDTSTQITDQANRAAEQYLNESKQKADELLADARKRSTLMVEDAENQSRYIKENILSDLKAMEHDFKAMESYKENLVSQIKTLANGALKNVERFEQKFSQQSLQTKMDEIAVSTGAVSTGAVSTEAALSPETVELPTDPAGNAEAAPVQDNHIPTEAEAAAAQGTEAAEAGLPLIEPVAETETLPANAEQPEHEQPQDSVIQASIAADEPQAETSPTEATQPVAETASPDEKPKGGSFFDQI